MYAPNSLANTAHYLMAAEAVGSLHAKCSINVHAYVHTYALQQQQLK